MPKSLIKTSQTQNILINIPIYYDIFVIKSIFYGNFTIV
nr:MAG TPA: hypothetical protein [Caudoviricetes sp.]